MTAVVLEGGSGCELRSVTAGIDEDCRHTDSSMRVIAVLALFPVAECPKLPSATFLAEAMVAS